MKEDRQFVARDEESHRGLFSSMKISTFEDKGADFSVTEVPKPRVETSPGWSNALFHFITSRLSKWGIETHGITPVHPEQRMDPRLYQVFVMWFSANMNIITFGTGTAGPAFFGLGVRTSVLTVLITDAITVSVPAFFAVLGPKMGTRAMVQSRFSWGYYGAIIPSVLNILTNEGFLIINAILGGQALAAASDHLSTSVGIVIVSLISLAVTFCGYQVLHWYEALSWAPILITFIVILGVGGKHLAQAPVMDPSPAPASAIFSFGATLAANAVSWASLTPDYGVHHKGDAPSLRIFLYAYCGFFISMVPVHMLGAVFAAVAYTVPSWQAGLGNGNDVGGLIGAILEPTGGFGKFLVVVFALTTPSASAPTLYTVCTSFMTVSSFFARIPRVIIAVLATAIAIPISIVGASRFYATFVQILSFMGYWLAPWTAIVIVEHFVFRRASWATYDTYKSWDKPTRLPPGCAALFTFVATIGVVVLCMQQEWWTGPIARAGSGDVGMLIGFFVGVLFYSSSRWLERRHWGR